MLESKRNSLANYDSYQIGNLINIRFESPTHINIKNRESYFALSPVTDISYDKMNENNNSRVLSQNTSVKRNHSISGKFTTSYTVETKINQPLKNYRELTPQPSCRRYGRNETLTIERALKSPVRPISNSEIYYDYESQYGSLRLNYEKVLSQLQAKDKELLHFKKDYDDSQYQIALMKKQLISLKESSDKKLEELKKSSYQTLYNNNHNRNINDIKLYKNELSEQLNIKYQEIHHLKNLLEEMKINNQNEMKEFEANIFILNQDIKHKDNEIAIKDIEIQALIKQYNENGHQHRETTINKDLSATPKKHTILRKKEKKEQKEQLLEENEQLKQINSGLELTIASLKDSLDKAKHQEQTFSISFTNTEGLINSNSDRLRGIYHKYIEDIIPNKTLISAPNIEKKSYNMLEQVKSLNEQQELDYLKKEISKLEIENMELNKEVITLKSSCLKLKEEGNKAQDQLKEVRIELDKVKLDQQLYRSINVDVKNHIQEKEKYKRENEDLKMENNILYDKLKGSKNTIKANENSMSSTRTSTTLNLSGEINNQKNINEKMKEDLEILKNQNKIFKNSNENLLKELEQKKLKIKDREDFINRLTLQMNEALDQIEQFKVYHLTLKQEYNNVNEELENLKKNYEIENIKFPNGQGTCEKTDDHMIKLKSDLSIKQKETVEFKIKSEGNDNSNEDILHSEIQVNKNRFSFGNRESNTDAINCNREENGLMKKLKSLNEELDKIDQQI